MESYQKFFHQYFLLYRPFISELNNILNEYDLHYSQWSILYYLDRDESATLVQLAKHLYVEKPTITRTVHSLIKLGYIEQIPGKDQREKRIQLNTKGKDVTSKLRQEINEYEQKIMAGVSEEQQGEMVQLLAVVRNNIIKGEKN